MVIDHDFTCVLRNATYVDVPPDGLVYHFLKEIKALGWDVLDDTSGDLNVWKLCTPLPSVEIKRGYLAKLKRQEIPKEWEEEEKKKGKPKSKPKGKAKVMEKEREEWGVALLLNPGDKISLHFEELSALESNIRILVQVPASAGGTSCYAVNTRYQSLWTSSKHKFQLFVIYPSANLTPAPQDEYPFKRRRLADDPGPSWLEEVHSKIWNRKELEPELFRKVKVTQAHYTQLQMRLEAQHPDRDLPEYDGKDNDVLSVKLDFLRSIPPLFSHHPDNDDDDSEASNEDPFEIDSFFPRTLNFFDMSTLSLKNNLPAYIPMPLFLRQEYNYISTLIEKEPRRNVNSVIVSGQPGTGEVLVSLSVTQGLTSSPISRQDRVSPPEDVPVDD